MAAGADSIDDLDVIRHGGMKRLFGEVYAPSTLGSFPRSFTHGHVQQLVVVLRAMLVSLAAKTQVLAGADQMTFVDIDSLLRRVYGNTKRGARSGPAKVGGYQLLLRGLSPSGGHDLHVTGGSGDRRDAATGRQCRFGHQDHLIRRVDPLVRPGPRPGPSLREDVPPGYAKVVLLQPRLQRANQPGRLIAPRSFVDRVDELPGDCRGWGASVRCGGEVGPDDQSDLRGGVVAGERLEAG